MVQRLVIVDDEGDESDRDESHIPHRLRSDRIAGPLRRRLVMALALQRQTPGQIAIEFDLPRETVYRFKFRNKREIQELARQLMTTQKELFFADQVKRIQMAEEHLLLVNDQIRLMLEAVDREDDPVALDMKEFRGLMAEANRIRKEIAAELKPTMSLGDIQITPPKKYGGQEWFEDGEKP
jgi:hypothetical protein